MRSPSAAILSRDYLAEPVAKVDDPLNGTASYTQLFCAAEKQRKGIGIVVL
jgi:hypothetical protein